MALDVCAIMNGALLRVAAGDEDGLKVSHSKSNILFCWQCSSNNLCNDLLLCGTMMIYFSSGPP